MISRSQILKSSKVIQKKRKKYIIITLLSFLCSIIFLIVLIFILRLPSLQISTIKTNVEYSSEIEKVALQVLNDSYLYIIPKTNFLLYPRSSLKKVLLESFKNIDSLEIKRKGINTLNINIKEKSPIAIACEGFYSEELDNEKCFLIDENGYIFSNIKDSVIEDFNSDLFLKFYLLSNLKNSLIDTHIVDKERFKELINFSEIAKKGNLNPQGILIGANGNYEMYAKNKDGSDLIIYFNDKYSFDKSASNLIAFWENSSQTDLFDSINLRFGNNIFYVSK